MRKLRAFSRGGGITPSKALSQFWDDTEVTDQVTMMEFFKQLARFLPHHDNSQKVVLIIIPVVQEQPSSAGLT